MIVLASQLMKIVAACRQKLLPKRSNGVGAAGEGAISRLPPEVPVRVQCFGAEPSLIVKGAKRPGYRR
jgi:hypothetical protein